jgi:hypothetical protein
LSSLTFGRKAGISEANIDNWRKKYAGLMPSEMKRLRQLEENNTKLKRIDADLSLVKAMLQDILAKKCMIGPVRARVRDIINGDFNCINVSGLSREWLLLQPGHDEISTCRDVPLRISSRKD